MAAPRFGIVFLPESLRGFGELCTEAEAHGFDWLGVADSQSVFRELYVALTLAALHTRRMRLGPLVTNPLTRHLVVTASAISSVDELSGGRAVLGVGSGDSALYTIGAPPATLAGLEDSVLTLGRLTAGETVERDGRTWRVQRSTRRVPRSHARGDRPVACRHRARRARRRPQAGRPRRVVVREDQPRRPP